MRTPEMWVHLIKEIRTLGPGWLAPQRADDGDVMKLQIKVEDGVITDARFKT